MADQDTSEGGAATEAASISFDPDDLRAAGAMVRKLRTDFLFDADADAASGLAEQYFLLALGSLDQAERFLEIAACHQAQANAAVQTGRLR